MRFALVLAAVLAMTVVAGGTPARAASRQADWNVEVARKDGHLRHYYRKHGKGWRRHYRAPVSEPAPVRPLSCGEFRFWDGTQCVDVRFR